MDTTHPERRIVILIQWKQGKLKGKFTQTNNYSFSHYFSHRSKFVIFIFVANSNAS